MVAAGLCHTDLSVLDGTIPWPAPAAMGHEGAGIVEAVGECGHAHEAGRPHRGVDHRELREVPTLQYRPPHTVPRVDRQPIGAVHVPR